MVTADRRLGSMGVFGGDDADFLNLDSAYRIDSEHPHR